MTVDHNSSTNFQLSKGVKSIETALELEFVEFETWVQNLALPLTH